MPFVLTVTAPIIEAWESSVGSTLSESSNRSYDSLYIDNKNRIENVNEDWGTKCSEQCENRHRRESDFGLGPSTSS